MIPSRIGRVWSMAKKVSRPLRPRVSSAPQDQIGPWGEELYPRPPDPGFAVAGLFIPRTGRAGAETFSPAASIRYSAVAGTPLPLSKPTKDPVAVLQNLGLVSTRFPQRLTDMKASKF